MLALFAFLLLRLCPDKGPVDTVEVHCCVSPLSIAGHVTLIVFNDCILPCLLIVADFVAYSYVLTDLLVPALTLFWFVKKM